MSDGLYVKVVVTVLETAGILQGAENTLGHWSVY